MVDMKLLAFQAIGLACCYFFFKLIMAVPLFRKQMRRVFSKKGPFYKLAVYIAGFFVRLVLRDNAYVKPTTQPKLKCSKRSSNGILVSYTYKESSKWGRDTVEIEAKEDYDETDVWKPLEIDAGAQTAALRNITPGVTVLFRSRMSNVKGASDWSPDFPVLSLQMPVDGGGAGPGYWWRQTTKSVQVVIKVPRETRGKHVDVKIGSTKLSASLKDRDPPHVFFAAVDLHKAVRPAESIWELVDEDPLFEKGQMALIITLEKLDRTFMSTDHWDRLIDKHPPIDTSLIPMTLPQEFD
mmetsp:Transcript_20273/g.65583  ORF Transcript_20273/g.65583 Transcript_20273/m.65583 type:complete len:296 (+) Transcript_20273:55-942(+)